MTLAYSYWSNSFWNLLDVIINNTNENNKINTIIVLNSIGNLLPCEYCNKHYKKYLEKNYLTYDNSEPEKLKIWLENLKKEILVQKSNKSQHNVVSITNKTTTNRNWGFKQPSKGYAFSNAGCSKCMEEQLNKSKKQV